MYKMIRSIARLRCTSVCGRLGSVKLTKISQQYPARVIHTSMFLLLESKDREKIKDKDREKKKEDFLPSVTVFFHVKNKNRETFAQALEVFVSRDPRRKGHVEFIYAALKYMEDFGVDFDLESYKNLIRVLPAGKFVPRNMIQAEFMHFPRQQQCAVDLLDTMERKGIMPDTEMRDLLIERFGKTGIPVRKHARMMYWMMKFKNTNPWPVPRPTPTDAYELAKLAIERITSVDIRSVVKVLQTQDVIDSVDDTWIVSGQSPAQQRLLANLPKDSTVHVEGPFLIWLRNLNVQYFTLRADPYYEPVEPPDTDDVTKLSAPWEYKRKPTAVDRVRTVHEQDDGVILAVCATGTSSRDSLLSWVRLLQRDGNQRLASIPILFKLRSSAPSSEVVPVSG